MFRKVSTDKRNVFFIDGDRTRETIKNPEMSLIALKEIDHVDMFPAMLGRLSFTNRDNSQFE